MTIYKVIFSLGKRGFTTGYPSTSLNEVLRETFLASTNCMSATEAKLLDSEAIFTTVELSMSSLSLFF